MSDQDCGKNSILFVRRRKKTGSGESNNSLTYVSDNARAKKARVSDSIEQNEGLRIVIPLEEDRGFDGKAVSQENGMNLGGKEAGGSGERGVDKSDDREFGEIGSIPCGFTSMERSEAILGVDDVEGKDELDIDLNFPALEVAEVDGTETDNTQFRHVIDDKKVEIIHIDSDDCEDNGEQLVKAGKNLGKIGCERRVFCIDTGRMETGPFVDGSTSTSRRRRFTKEEKGKEKEVDNWLSIANGESKRGTDLSLQRIEIDLSSDESDRLNDTKKYSKEEKGKGKVVDNWLSIYSEPMEIDSEPELDKSFQGAASGLVLLNEALGLVQAEELGKKRDQAILTAQLKASRRRAVIRYSRENAKNAAAKLANRDSEQLEGFVESHKLESILPFVETDTKVEDFPGPFSTALKLIKDRNNKLNAQKKSLTIDWIPSRKQDHNILAPFIPSLLNLSFDVLAKNADAIVSLEPAPDALKHKLSHVLCDSRKMNGQFAQLLVSGSPTEVRLKDCSWMTEQQFINIFGSCDYKNLRVLQLDLCGRCMTDYTLHDTLVCSSNSFLALSSISLRGACRLSDIGLNALTVSTPSLQSINLSQCSLLTFAGINTLANCFGMTLRELYMDDCQNIDALLILPALKKFEHLEVLSVAGIQTVCDDFVSEILTACGPNMKELVLANCVKLTDLSLRVIGNTCHKLCALDLFNLHNLTDYAIQYLANGCRSIQTLKLCRNGFSDEAMAAFLEVSGKYLKELSLNNIKVGPNTALSLAKYSRDLLILDLSWCRKLTNEALGLIVDNCMSLRLLKLFGCTQITDVFLNGHSNSSVRIIGLKTTPVMEYLDVLECQQAPLRYSPIYSPPCV